MKQDELQKVLENHILWLYGRGGERADLSGVDLRDADLSHANLRYADLRYADLRVANLRVVNLSYANLSYANISDANISDANLRGADLRGADLRGADLSGADIENVQYDESTAFFALQCPEEGSFVGWKKCQDNVLVKLFIPEDAKRSSATSRKCRASKAVVLEVIGANEGLSQHDTDFVYEVGKEVVADSFDDDRWNKCSHGIHFFITRKEAQNY